MVTATHVHIFVQSQLKLTGCIASGATDLGVTKLHNRVATGEHIFV